MRVFIKKLTSCVSVILFFILTLGIIISYSTPDNYKVTATSGIEFNTFLPVTAKTVNTEGDKTIKAGVIDNSTKKYHANIMLMNSIPIKQTNVEMVEDLYLCPCGEPFGIKIFTQGVVVVGMSDVQSDNGPKNPAKESGLKVGDVILSAGGEKVNTNEEIASVIEKSEGKEILLSVKRNNTDFEAKLVPVRPNSDENYKAGLWVRDSSAGLGTLTFYDQTRGVFAGLGHGVCDTDTGELLPLLNGDIVSSNINGIVKGTRGSPGELKGYFCDNKAIGTLKSNDQTGVYGFMNKSPTENTPIKVGLKQQVVTGPAKVIITIDGNKPEYYDIEIESINYNNGSPTKNMIIRIKDPMLLEKTGGIIQGMSGSPIIQNDMLVGAVTHVFVNEPEKGYGIFIENMIEASQKLQDTEEIEQKNAS